MRGPLREMYVHGSPGSIRVLPGQKPSVSNLQAIQVIQAIHGYPTKHPAHEFAELLQYIFHLSRVPLKRIRGGKEQPVFTFPFSITHTALFNTDSTLFSYHPSTLQPLLKWVMLW